jgi:hypothetical protein
MSDSVNTTADPRPVHFLLRGVNRHPGVYGGMFAAVGLWLALLGSIFCAAGYWWGTALFAIAAVQLWRAAQLLKTLSH